MKPGVSDRADPIKKFRRRFATRPGTIYLDGNSLGLLSRDSEASLVKAVKSWKRFAVRGWLEAEPSSVPSRRESRRPVRVARRRRPPDESLCPGRPRSTYMPWSTPSTARAPRTKIVADALDFPTDIYALKSVLKLRGLDPPVTSSSSTAGTA